MRPVVYTPVAKACNYLVDLVQPKPHWHGLDVATGAGHTALTFAPLVKHITACDLTAPMLLQTAELAAAQKVVNIETRLADAEQLPFDDDSFDLLTCRLAFHHFADPARALSEFARVLKPGGTLGFTDNFTVEDAEAADYYNRYEQFRDPSHYQVYSLSELEKMMADAGFSMQAARKLTKEFQFDRWADRQQVSAADKATLLEMLRSIPAALKPQLAPRWADEAAYFTLWEAVSVAQRVGSAADL